MSETGSRAIKSRGKRVDNGEWVEGYFFASQMSGAFILSSKIEAMKNKSGMSMRDKLEQYEVDPATVGQFTTLSDKHGKDLWADDIVNIDGRKQNYRVGFTDGMYVFWASGGSVYHASKYCHMAELIGNIHDHPHLLNTGGDHQ